MLENEVKDSQYQNIAEEADMSKLETYNGRLKTVNASGKQVNNPGSNTKGVVKYIVPIAILSVLALFLTIFTWGLVSGCREVLHGNNGESSAGEVIVDIFVAIIGTVSYFIVTAAGLILSSIALGLSAGLLKRNISCKARIWYPIMLLAIDCAFITSFVISFIVLF